MLFSQELLCVSVHRSTWWYEHQKIWEGQKGCALQGCHLWERAQREVDGFAWRPNYLGVNLAKCRSWPTYTFVLEHGSCWIPDFLKESLRRAHRWCLRDIQICLKKPCMLGGTWLLDDYKIPVAYAFFNKFFQYHSVSMKPPFTCHICFSPSSSILGCASMQGHCWSWEWHELWYLGAQLRCSNHLCVWRVWNGVQLTCLDSWLESTPEHG